MSLRRKVLIVLAIGFLAAFATDSIIENAIVLPKFVALDQRRAERNLLRVKKALALDLQAIEQGARSYGQWDDAYEFLENRRPAFIQSNLSSESLTTMNVDWIEYFDAAGASVAGQQKDSLQANGIRRDVVLASLDLSNGKPSSPATPNGKSGFVRDGDHLILVTSQPVTDTLGLQPARGHVVFARMLAPVDIERIQRQTAVAFTLLPPDDKNLALPGVEYTACRRTIFSEDEPGTLLSRVCLVDVRGKPAAVIQAETLEEASAEGNAVLATERLWTLITMVALLGLAYWAIGVTVLRPVRRLLHDVNWIRQSGELTHRLGVRSKDEIGELARDIDLLLMQLARARAARLRSENQLNTVIRKQRETIRELSEGGQPAGHAER